MKILFNKVKTFFSASKALLSDETGDFAVDTLGKIIIAVVVVGIAIAAINQVFPTLFENILEAVESKLTANW